MNHLGIPHHARSFVGLQLPNEMPGQPRCQVSAFGRFGSRFLIPVLPHIPHPELVQQPHVRCRKSLRDRDQRHLPRIPPHRRTSRCDPPPNTDQPPTQLVPPTSARQRLLVHH